MKLPGLWFEEETEDKNIWSFLKQRRVKASCFLKFFLWSHINVLNLVIFKFKASKQVVF